jgi:transposase
MGEVLAMSEKERVRLVELARVSGGEQSVAAASRRLGLSYRQMKRLWRRYRSLGDAGLVHASRGRPSNRRKSAALRQRCLELYQERLEGFGPTLAAEKLLEWGFSVKHETLRRWRVAAGLWQSRARRARHRRWRPRKERFGLPRSLYVDRKSVYITGREPTIEEELAGQRPLTAFGAACHRLGIELIAASSPQAKGRVERSHGVYQDRLVKEIRLKGWRTLAEVNAELASFDTGLNQRFAVAAGSAEDAHRPAGPELDLSTVLVWEETRCVRNDWTLSYQGRCLQIVGPKRHLPPAKARVTVQRRLDGSLHLFYRSQPLLFEELPQRPVRALPPPAVVGSPSPRPPVRPAADHPWRRPWSRRAAATPATPAREIGAAVAYGS